MIKHLKKVGLPINIGNIEGSESWTPSSVLEHMRHDKKVLDGRLRLILARGIGKAFITSEIDEADIADVFDAFLSEA